MNTTHPFAPEELMAFVDGELSAAEGLAVSAHVAECAECTETLAGFREVSEALARWEVPVAAAEMDDAVKAEVVRAGERVAGGKVPAPWFGVKAWMLPGGLAAAAMLLVVLVLLRGRVSVTPAAPLKIAPQAEQSYPPIAGRSIPRPEMDEGTAGGRRLSQVTENLELAKAAAVSEPRVAAQSAVSAGSVPSAPMIARSVSLGIVVKNLEASRSALDGIVARRHGYSAELTESDPGGSGGTLHASVRVPVAELTAAVAELKLLGRTVNESQSGEEVTQRHADLVQRLKTARDTEERFRGILQQRTGSVADVLEVEEKIAMVRGEIEGMEAEQKALEHRVDYASVELSVSQEYKMPLEAPGDSFGVRSHNALVAGYQNALGTVVGLVLLVEEYGPALVVWVVLIGVPAWLGWRRFRRGRV